MPSSSFYPNTGKKHHSSAYKPPVTGKHQAGKLGTQATTPPHCLLSDGRQHHGINHTACGRQQILQCHRYTDHCNTFQEKCPVKFSGTIFPISCLLSFHIPFPRLYLLLLFFCIQTSPCPFALSSLWQNFLSSKCCS